MAESTQRTSSALSDIITDWNPIIRTSLTISLLIEQSYTDCWSSVSRMSSTLWKIPTNKPVLRRVVADTDGEDTDMFLLNYVCRSIFTPRCFINTTTRWHSQIEHFEMMKRRRKEQTDSQWLKLNMFISWHWYLFLFPLFLINKKKEYIISVWYGIRFSVVLNFFIWSHRPFLPTYWLHYLTSTFSISVPGLLINTCFLTSSNPLPAFSF